jgi:Bacteriophage Sf6, terminase small subunit-like
MPATTYSNSLAEHILAEIADGASLNKACDAAGAARRTVARWIMTDRFGFAERYKLARRIGTDIWAEEILDLADESKCAAGDMALLGSYKLRTDARRWLLSKLRPDTYADQVQHQLGLNTVMQVYLPIKGSNNDGGRLHDGGRLLEAQAEAVEIGDSWRLRVANRVANLVATKPTH